MSCPTPLPPGSLRPSGLAHLAPLFAGLMLLALLAGPVGADPVDLGLQVVATASQQRCSLDRRTRVQTCTADIALENRGPHRVLAPLHLVFLIQGSGVTMPGALAGVGSGPYGAFYHDLTPRLSGGQLPAGARLTVRATFQSQTPLSFQTRVYGVPDLPVNQPPRADAGAGIAAVVP